MCGIAGYLGRYDQGIAARMGELIAHRGPDDSDEFLDESGPVALAHRRLSILDPSPAGHQPMVDSSGRFVICYNGEIYNFPELKRELEDEGQVFRSNCDTEVIVELFARSGPDIFASLNGIFALAIWDRRERTLTLARDGFGVKPLYLAETPTGLAFASEIKAFLALPDLDRTIDRTAVASYLTFLWSPGERTMLTQVRKLPPGTWRRYRSGASEPIAQGRFYSIPAPNYQYGLDPESGAQATADELRGAVHRQMLSDVDVGAFLSGGLDSSAIVAFARERAKSGQLQCFTIDYRADSDETGELIPDLPYARKAASHLGVQLHELRVDASMADRFGELAYILDEPTADPAALNSLMISELARSHGIKVLLSGTGGDDLFSGYRRHQSSRLEGVFDAMPASVLSGLSSTVHRLPGSGTGLRRVRKLLANASRPRDLRMTGYFEWLPAEAACSLLADQKGVAAGDVRAPLLAEIERNRGHSHLETMLRLDQNFFLIDHNLNYADKTGMAAGVEIRVPFLDHRLVEWAARVPADLKLSGNSTKDVLRRAMEPYLPHDVIYRPKTGFGVPLRSWLKREMRDLLEDVLSPRAVRDRGMFDPAAVEALKASNFDGRVDASYSLLALMMIELWMRRFVDPVPTPASQAIPA